MAPSNFLKKKLNADSKNPTPAELPFLHSTNGNLTHQSTSNLYPCLDPPDTPENRAQYMRNYQNLQYGSTNRNAPQHPPTFTFNHQPFVPQICSNCQPYQSEYPVFGCGITNLNSLKRCSSTSDIPMNNLNYQQGFGPTLNVPGQQNSHCLLGFEGLTINQPQTSANEMQTVHRTVSECQLDQPQSSTSNTNSKPSKISRFMKKAKPVVEGIRLGSAVAGVGMIIHSLASGP